MPKKFFQDQESQLFYYSTLKIIEKIEALSSDDSNWYLTLKQLEHQLNEKMANPIYVKIPSDLKRKVKRIVAELAQANPPQNDEFHLLSEKESVQFTLQIPSDIDLTKMHGLRAGGAEDQSMRLKHMSQKIKGLQASNSLITTDALQLPQHWTVVFDLINQGDNNALQQFDTIPSDDPVLSALLRVHPVTYLKQIIQYSLAAHATGLYQLNHDMVFSVGTFEVLIKDLATTLNCPTAICVSFGLPSHHAYSDQGSGFCYLNKIAILLNQKAATRTCPIKHVIVGTDVNRDNGLESVLAQTAYSLNVCHIDIFDSRVYPFQDDTYISNELERTPHDLGQNIKHWYANNVDYYAVDLSQTQRTLDDSIHPAILFALRTVKEHILQAIHEQKKIMLYLPSGWDSHENETAYCGKFVDGKMMPQHKAKKCRFNDRDLTYFYDQLFNFYQTYKDNIEGIYWGLEGGYEQRMYEHQIELLLHSINHYLSPEPPSSPGFQV